MSQSSSPRNSSAESLSSYYSKSPGVPSGTKDDSPFELHSIRTYVLQRQAQVTYGEDIIPNQERILPDGQNWRYQTRKQSRDD